MNFFSKQYHATYLYFILLLSQKIQLKRGAMKKRLASGSMKNCCQETVGSIVNTGV